MRLVSIIYLLQKAELRIRKTTHNKVEFLNCHLAAQLGHSLFPGKKRDWTSDFPPQKKKTLKFESS